MASILSSRYQPSPRFYHYAGQVGRNSYMWGGCTQDFHHGGQGKLKSTVNVFDPYLETWQEQCTTGVPPRGLVGGAAVAHSTSLYSFAGHDGKSWHNSLHVLDTDTLMWKEIPSNSPIPKQGCGMVFFGTHHLATIGGYGQASQPIQTGSSFYKNPHRTDGSGWTNEFHVFDVTEDKWSSPTTTGPRPPPGSHFTFTAVNHHKAVYFGGFQPGRGGVNDLSVIDFDTMEWTKLEREEGAPWPVARSSHAACCLNYDDDQPVLLMTGGIDNNDNTLTDAWLLDINSGRWRELTLPEGTQLRCGHTLTAFEMDQGRVHATTFGGYSRFVRGGSDDDHPKLADTAVLEFESVQSGDTPSSREWVLVGVADSSQLGTAERTREFDKLQQKKKTERERERNTQKLQEEVLQMEEKVATAQKKARQALARAVRAEQEADQVPVLEQQLSQTKENLEEQIHMNDEARIAAQQRFDQTRAALEHQIQVRDQTNTALQQTYYQMKATLEHQIELWEQATVSIQQQFHQMKSALEHQLREKEQVRVALEAQIRAKDQEKGELERQLYRKDEHIRALQQSQSQQVSAVAQTQEKAKATQVPYLTKPSQVDSSTGASYAPTSQITAVEVAEVQKISGDGPVIAQEEAAIAQQLMETRREVGAREEELGQATELAAKLQLELESKNLEVTFLRCDGQEKDDEIATIKRHRAEENKALQSQVDSLQIELRNLQQNVAEKKNKIAAIINDSQCNQDRIETLELEKQELTTQMTKVEFFRDTYSLEIDQLRDDLMDKEVEIDFLRKEQVHMLPTSTSSPVVPFRGAEIVAQTTFTLSQESQNLQFEGYGFKLHVPEGSLPAEVSEAKLDVQVSLSGQFQMPPDCELISAIYWVYSPHKFIKPLTVEIQHCAVLSSDQQCSQLAFVSTKCTQKELPYLFKTRDGGVFSHHSSYGSLSLTQFSGVGVVKRKIARRSRRAQPYPPTSIQTTHDQPKQLASANTETSTLSAPSVGAVESLEIAGHDKEIFDQYCGQVYTRKGVNDCRVHFVITKNLDAHRTAVEVFYTRTSHVREDTEMSLGFDGENISLSVPRKGVKLKSGWKIIPLYDPIIRKGNVDHFSGGQMIPRCELLLRWPYADKPHVCLEHGIDLIGATGCSFFTLYIPDAAAGTLTPSAGVPSPSSKSSVLSPTGAISKEFSSEITIQMSAQKDTKILGGKTEGAPRKPVMKDLMDALYHKVADKWKAVGVLLEIPKGTLAGIAEKCQHDPHKCLLEMLETWLERIHPPASWAAIVEAVEFLGEEQLGRELRQAHSY